MTPSAVHDDPGDVDTAAEQLDSDHVRILELGRPLSDVRPIEEPLATTPEPGERLNPLVPQGMGSRSDPVRDRHAEREQCGIGSRDGMDQSIVRRATRA